ncbi:MAG: hypothetical protein EZS28_021521 [Streblomastix strix]|uniref:Uncharacterized protein n=1 Tax=Streblomastix strix TaxID=222440 RepID=A0A5J4VKE4_9EUKA|nr:MAG: hypothetical protein EZS28_021521 [Streblomastix strix]
MSLRDIRIGKISGSRYKKRLCVIDWGSVVECSIGGGIVRYLRGNVSLASDSVLEQLSLGSAVVKFILGYDYEGFVKCMFGIINGSVLERISRLQTAVDHAAWLQRVTRSLWEEI